MSTLLASFLFLFMSLTPALNEDSVDSFNESIKKSLMKDTEQSLVKLDSAIQMSKQIGYSYGEGYALYLKSYIFRQQSESGKAFVANLKALQLLNNLRDKRSAEIRSVLYLTTARILRIHYKYEEAINYYNKGIEIAELYKFNQDLIDFCYNKGFTLRHKGDLNEAVNSLKRAYELAILEESEIDIVNSLNLLGLSYRDNGKYEESLEYFQQMLDFNYWKINQHKFHGRAYHNMANVYKTIGDLITAEFYYDKALVKKQQYENAKDLFVTQMDLASLYFETERIEEANQLATLAVANYEQLSAIPENYKIYDLLKKIAAVQNDLPSVVAYSDKYVAENNQFLEQQKELIKIRDQFKMEILSASYFNELDRERRIADLYDYIIYGLLIIAFLLTLNKIRIMWRKRILERDLKQAFDDFGDIEKLL